MIFALYNLYKNVSALQGLMSCIWSLTWASDFHDESIHKPRQRGSEWTLFYMFYVAVCIISMAISRQKKTLKLGLCHCMPTSHNRTVSVIDAKKTHYRVKWHVRRKIILLYNFRAKQFWIKDHACTLHNIGSLEGTLEYYYHATPGEPSLGVAG